jgi:hypothetical protein
VTDHTRTAPALCHLACRRRSRAGAPKEKNDY